MNILILDASLVVLQKIENLLFDINFEDLDLRSFQDAEEALEYIRENKVDLIFSSIETEGIDGITFVDLILRDNPAIVSKLFIVTSQNNTNSITDIKGVGAKRFIKKPINEEYFRHFVIPEIHKALKISKL